MTWLYWTSIGWQVEHIAGDEVFIRERTADVLRCIDGNPVQVIGSLLDWLDVGSTGGNDLFPYRRCNLGKPVMAVLMHPHGQVVMQMAGLRVLREGNEAEELIELQGREGLAMENPADDIE